MNDPQLVRRAIALHDEFTHTHLDRRRFFSEMVGLSGSAASAALLINLIMAQPAAAAKVPPEDSRISASWVTIPGPDGQTYKAYLAEPRGPAAARYPAVLVIHENRGLNAYVEDVTRRLAADGFAALAVDFLSPLGGTPADEDAARNLIAKITPQDATAAGVAAIDWLARAGFSNGKVGAIGFCWGGAMVNRLAVTAGDKLAAGIVFYGPAPEEMDAAKVKAAMMLHYAGEDPRVNASAGQWVELLEKAGVPTTRYDYPGTQHAFHNDTSAARFDPKAADLAWQRSIAFLRAKLGG